MKGSIRVGAVALLLACGGDSPSDPVPDDVVTIDGPATLAFDRVGAEATLTATVSRVGAAVRWASTSPSVATVDGGLVTSRGDGSAFIVARSGEAADSVAVTVAQVPVQLAFIAPPDHALRGVPFATAPRLAVVDAAGAPVRRFAADVHVSLAGGGGATLGGTTVRPAQDGVATFADLSIDDVGSGYVLEARTSDGSFTARSVPFDVLAEPDRIVARNAAGDPIGLLIDGAGASRDFDDIGRLVQDSVANVIADASFTSNTVMAFTRGRPPVVFDAPWSAGTDTVAFAFPDAIAFPVTVWVIKGPYEQQRARAAAAIATTELIWDEERMGLSFSDVEFVDATSDPDAPALHDLTLCNQQTLATNTIGKRAGRINIYYVGTVDNGTDRGRACPGGDFTMMAERSGHELLSHEIGHLFGLGHVDGDDRFDRTNVMHSASNTRQFLTEAQVFRSHYNAFSALRFVYGLRDDVARTCTDYDTSTACPSLARRLFADGSFPADPVASTAGEYLRTTCMAGDESALPDDAVAAHVLIDAIERGAPSHVVDGATSAAGRRADALRARIAEGRRFGLDEGALAALRTALHDAYTEHQVDDVRRSWRENAVLGLATLHNETATRALARIAVEGGELAEVARRALRSR